MTTPTTINIQLVGGEKRTYQFGGRATQLQFRNLFFTNKKYSDGKPQTAGYTMDQGSHNMVIKDKTLFDRIIAFLDKLNTNKDNDITDKKNNKNITIIDDTDIENVKSSGSLEHHKDGNGDGGRIRDKENNFIFDYYEDCGYTSPDW